jgi:hypothetical protein
VVWRARISIKQAVDDGPVGTQLGFSQSKTLTAGKAAVQAEVEESWTTPVDTRLHARGGIVFRRLRSEVIEDQLSAKAPPSKRI